MLVISIHETASGQMSRPQSRRNKNPLNLSMAGPKTMKIVEGKSEYMEFHAPSKDSLPEKIYTIESADDPTYISMLKSDIYQVQRRLEKAKRSLQQMMGSRPTSARGRDIHAITEATSEVDAVLKSAKKSKIKLRLMELLNSKMVLLETVVLRLADGARVFRNVSSNYGSPSMSRLPAFLEIIDQLLALQKMAARAPMRLDSDMDLDKNDRAPLPNAIKALEKEMSKLATAFELNFPDSSGELSARRVANAASFLQEMESKKISKVLKDLKDAMTTNSQLRDDTACLHKDLKTAHEKIKTLSMNSGNTEFPEAGTNDNIDKLEAKWKTAQAELEKLRNAKGRAEDAKAEAIEAVKQEMMLEITRLKSKSSQKEAMLAKTREELAQTKQMLSEANIQARAAERGEQLATEKASADASRILSQKESLEAKIKIMEEKNKGLEEALSGKSSEILNEAFKKELDAAKAEIEKRQRTLAGLDMSDQHFCA